MLIPITAEEQVAILRRALLEARRLMWPTNNWYYSALNLIDTALVVAAVEREQPGEVEEHPKQPDPVPGKQDITELVIADLLHRNKLGIETYGRPLESHNGRNALLDTYEELLDAVKYLKQRLVEEEDSKNAG